MRGYSTLTSIDRAHVWHPYASPFPTADLPVVREARGARLVIEDARGLREVVDGMASWWCAVHGYRNPVLDQAVTEQVGRFSHVMFGGLTHEPAVTLAESLVELAPDGLTRVFLADSGSVAMEVALKVALQTALAKPGVRRTRFAALRGGYHGDTWGVMSVCDPDGGMHSIYAGAVQPHVFLPRPPAPGDDEALATWQAEVDELIHAHRDELAAIVCEPLLQGAGGMWTYDARALRHLRQVADEHDLLLVVDEIATGFGRTGTLWACDAAGITPDVMAIGKALTGGYVTQAAVLCTEKVAQALADGPAGVLMHGPTFMANPLACAISNASVGIIAEGGWQADVARIADRMRAELAPLRSAPNVVDVRILGATAAIELDAPIDMALATRTAIDHGVWLRPFRNLVYAMPPYVATDADLATLGSAMRAVAAALEARRAA